MTVLDEYLEILLAVDEGDVTLASIARATGRSEAETLEALGFLQRSGFIAPPPHGVPDADRVFAISAAGKTFLRLGYDEVFKRTLAERLGGDADSAS